jgi:multiple sugar transport system permease protein/putative aldouronate transport system permease protein
VLILVSYPLIYVVSASFSSGDAVSSGKVLLWPVDFSLEGYNAVFKNKDIVGSYGNTILYTILGTIINVCMVMTCAYALSRPNLKGRNIFMFLFTFTMFFSGGLIPSYILMKDLKLIDTIWVMVLPGELSVYNMIIARTFIQSSIPSEIFEAASIDGCSDAKFFFSMVLPLSKAVIAVIALFSAVGHWNSYFSAMIYLYKRALFPLQIILREILIMSQIDVSMIMDPELQQANARVAAVLKYSLIVVATVPILCVYPFAQKYFVTGVMIGSVKG